MPGCLPGQSREGMGIPAPQSEKEINVEQALERPTNARMEQNNFGGNNR